MFNIKQIDSHTLDQWQAEKRRLRLIDVRSHDEMEHGVITGAQALPLHILPLKAEEIVRQLDPEESVVFYCRSGARSAQACMYMTSQLGIRNVYNLEQGIMGWVAAGKGLFAGEAILAA